MLSSRCGQRGCGCDRDGACSAARTERTGGPPEVHGGPAVQLECGCHGDETTSRRSYTSNLTGLVLFKKILRQRASAGLPACSAGTRSRVWQAATTTVATPAAAVATRNEALA